MGIDLRCCRDRPFSEADPESSVAEPRQQELRIRHAANGPEHPGMSKWIRGGVPSSRIHAAASSCAAVLEVRWIFQGGTVPPVPGKKEDPHG